ncbi:hypothetical protein [Alcanivorax quisquiliarum]|uniref:AraC family transcriptional regulator n=1 Tax=Alcanivorax quisquiliarum TaxID=2933565 RepID=A0ABT0E487_9GAMM|nr:hypothetical protein [Alcanivorax quisquiliarum]MCK0536630.1 hypothetical protein [Alcanivorax quisquiliarum]
MKIRHLLLAMLVTVGCVPAAVAQDTGLSQRIQALKEQVLDLDRDLTLLEEELLYPSSQASFFLSVDVGTPIRLVDIKLTLNGEHIGYHFYSEHEFEALTKGGIQLLHTGNVRSGRNELEVSMTGYDPRGQDYQRTVSHIFNKGPGRKHIELRVVDDLDAMQHRFDFREWDQ